MKPKSNHAGDAKKSNAIDRCQTPGYAIDPLIQYLSADWVIWECAAGEGNLVRELMNIGHPIVGTDILDGPSFFDWQPDNWDAIVTNPPYSIKYRWLERCYNLGKPFALLMPVETLGSSRAQRLFERYGLELILLDKRVNFKMPYKGYSGGGAQFPVAWFTHGLEIGKQITFAKIIVRDDCQPALFT